MENKQNEKSSYSLSATVISGKLKLQLTYEGSKHDYIGLYDVEQLRACGLPANLCTDLHNASKFLMAAKYGVEGINFLIKLGEGGNSVQKVATISVFQEIGVMRILDVKLELEENPRDRFDILEEQIRDLKSENQLLKLQVTQHACQKGCIIMWSGSIDDIPKGWQLCDGKHGAPDLRDRFIIGAGKQFGPNVMGGSKHHEHKLEIEDHIIIPSEELPFKKEKPQMNNLYSEAMIIQPYSVGQKGHNHDASCMRADHLPPYYALCFIVKVI